MTRGDAHTHTHTGTSCNYSRDKIECFRDLSIEIPQTTSSSFSLSTVLSQHFADEKVELRCEKCKGEHAVISPRIKKLPPVLMIHLKRFHLNMQAAKIEKLNALIDAPESLNLKTFMDSKDQNHRTGYQLRGILRHHGRTAQGGHYTADMCLKLGGKGGDEKKSVWHSFDDSRVRKGKFGNYERERQETGYVLVYVNNSN